MLAKESGGGSDLDLPEEVLEFLPSDPLQQLDVARKIASIALSTRVSALESESSAKLAEKDQLIAVLQSRIDSLGDELSDSADKLSRADEEKENLVKENTLLSNTVKKLNRDVSKLEVFRKTLMQSLQEYEENSAGAPEVVAKIQTHSSLSSGSQIGGPLNYNLSSGSQIGEDNAEVQSEMSEVGNSFAEIHETGGAPSLTGKIQHDVAMGKSQPGERVLPSPTFSISVGFGQPAQIGSGQKARLFGTGFDGGFAGRNSTGGFAGAASTGGGFAGLASGGGGFASSAPASGGFGGAASAGGGFAAFSSQQGSCGFSAFSSGTGGTGKLPELFSQIRK